MNEHHPEPPKTPVHQVTIKIALRNVTEEPPAPPVAWYQALWHKLLACFER